MYRTRVGLWTFLTISVVAAAVFARLGVWQLDRLAERREENRRLEARMNLPIMDLSAVGETGTADSIAWRRVRIEGTWDRDHTMLVRGRGYRGAPGVHVVAPLRWEPDGAALVLRGWLPAADGVSADLDRVWPEFEVDTVDAVEVRLEGLALRGEPASSIPPRTRSVGARDYLILGSLDIEQAASALPYEVLPVFVLAAEGTEVVPGAPLAVPAPPLSDGTHLSYAIQWFSFSAIALVGAGLYYRTRRRGPESEGGQA